MGRWAIRRRGIALAGLLAAAVLLFAAAAPAQAADPVIAAAGDIACIANAGLPPGQCHEQNTANLLTGTPGLSAVLPVGDLQYECGAVSAWPRYDQTWGVLKGITYPVPGNHEYNKKTLGECDPAGANTADGYFGYLNTLDVPPHLPAAAKDPNAGYYSYDIGMWHIIALNTGINCNRMPVKCFAGSPQEKWLKQDLASHPNACTLAYFHYPRFSSKTVGQTTTVAPFWNDLYAAGADVVLGGHVHSYERFAPQKPDGTADPFTGIREFTVGTGGRSLEAFPAMIAANSEVRSQSFGVLKLTLHPTSYDWQFVGDGTTSGKGSDSGTASCHGVPDVIPPTVSVTSPANGSTVSGTRALSATATDGSGIARVDFLVDGTVVGTSAAMPYAAQWDTTKSSNGVHQVSARAFDAVGNQATSTVTVTVNNFIPVVTNPVFGPPPPPGTRRSSDILSVGTNGRGLRKLTSAPAGVDFDSADWSPTGRLIAFSGATCPTCPSGLFLMTPGGGGLRVLANVAPGATRPDWGRLDRTLTFVGGPTNAVYTVRSSGAGQRQLTSGSAPHDESALTNDGRMIAFTTQLKNGRWEILTALANGARKRNLTRTPLATELQPTWSRDGKRIAYVRKIGTRWSVYIRNANGRGLRRLTPPALNCQQPAWSPNGKLIACTRFTPTSSSILMVKTVGRAVVRKLNTGTITAWAPTWSPNGARIAFTSIG